VTERTHIPRPNLPNSAACGQWETLLADALDGLLAPADEATFSSHMASCKACTALFDEARRGREWLEFLAPEPEVPAGLVDRILAHTGPSHKAAQPVLAGAGAVALPTAIPAWQRPGFMGRLGYQVRRWAEPRLMMTAAMAFFSIALTLNLAGVRLGDIRVANLRPTAVRSFMERRITMASVPIVRYYDHLRFVYEVQSRMRQMRNDSQESQPKNQPSGPGESKQNQKDGGSRVEQPQQSAEPAQANNTYNPDYIETSMKLNSTNLNSKHLKMMDSTRAFRRLQNLKGRRASERSRVWIA
jgi:Putative zinc-finger